MAITELTYIWLGSVATLATIGMFVEFGDDETQIVVSFTASVLWGLFGMSGFDVVIDDAATVSEPLYALAYMGIGFSIITALFALYGLLQVLRGETEQTDPEQMMP